ncbi:PKD domain-containing protein [Terrabacter sp. MAHUQ-38]|uniref:PKD domain-containing protein n=1 Tax=unclassified Terrabacter TaxID=2630222 RepID=UPI00165E3CB9|nr:PKD domain-containing protein [Terrabacter sp. MAHUQ-38]MBC9822419.1 right-handed parallel beta-helix repeat-containing protein [Terrabacter sp. MAHUQ-38]
MHRRGLTGTLAVFALALGTTLVSAGPAAAATAYWVDNTVSCSNTGTGTETTPFCTISAAATRATAAGDVVNVRPGTYAEQVTVNGSGAAGSPIRFVATGPGVLVLGSKDVSAGPWTDAGGGVWSTPYAPASTLRQVFVDGTRLTLAASQSAMTSGSFFHDATTKVLYLNVGGASPSGSTVVAGAQTYGFNVASRSNIEISGFETRGQNNAGVRITGSSGVAVDHVSSTESGINGVLVEGTSSNVVLSSLTVSRSASIGIKLTATTGSRVSGSTVSASGLHGISLQGASGNTIEGNESFGNVVPSGSNTAAGIDVNSTSPDTVVRGNVVHDNQDSGIQVYNGSARALVVRNVSYRNGDHGFDTQAAVNTRYISNTAYGNRKDGFSVEGVSTGATLRNNIGVDNGLATGENDLYVEQTSMTGFSADSDLFWNSSWVPAIRIGLTRYRTMAEFTQGTGQEPSGLGQDPQFVDAAAGDLRLSAQSAAIDSADAGAAGFEPVDRVGTSVTDDPTVVDRGAGTPAYADRGALERLPQAGDSATNAPHAALVVSTTTGQVPPAVHVTADATGSSDVDGAGITAYTFNFGDGTVVGPQASGIASHDYVTSGTHVVTVTVTDAGGLTSTGEVPVALTDRPLVTYHVDGASPSCSDSGNGTTTPFCTISRAASLALAGDSVVVEAGDYREQVTPTNDGMATAPLTFRANGVARVIGTTNLSNPALWTATSTSAWRTPLTSASPVTQVLRDGARLAAASSATTTTAGSFFFDAAGSTLYVDLGGSNPGSSVAIEASTRTYGFKLWSSDSVVVDGFSFVGQNGVGVSIQDSAGMVVSSVRVTSASSYGISSDRSTGTRVSGSTSTGNGSIGIRVSSGSGAVIAGNTVSTNGYHGISIQGSTGASVAGNVAHDNAHPTQRLAAGIDLSLGSTGATVEDNTSYSNQDSGIEIYTDSTNATVRRNLAYDNGDHGLDCLRSAGDRVIGNTVVGNSAAGINLEGGCSGAVVANNISVDNAVGSDRTIGDIRLDEISTPGSVVTRNVVFMTAGGPLYEWNSAPYDTVDAFRAASGQGAADIGEDPRFVDPAAFDLRLQVTSPAVDSAHLGIAGASVDDHDGVAPVDVVAVADTGAGSPAYGDRGALEYNGSAQSTEGPVAALSASPASGVAPLSVTLSAAGTTPGGSPVTGYTFRCGNGTTVGPQTGATAACAYAAVGVFTASVDVTDANGFTSSATATVTVAGNQAPVASLTASPSSGKAPLTVTLDATGSSDPEGRSLTYTFTCSSGSAAIGPQSAGSTSCTYPSAGTFTASVTVTDDAGATASATATVTVSANLPPTARLAVSPATGVVPFVVALDATGSSDPEGAALTYTFSCGNGAAAIGPQSARTASCTYSTAGTFTASVTVSDGGSTAQATATVTANANQAPKASMKMTSAPAAVAPTTATFDASASSDPEGRPLSYTFTCGNGTKVGPQTSAVATCSYSAGGTFNAKLTVTDDAGQQASSPNIKLVIGSNKAPVASLTVTLSATKAPTVATLDASKSSDPEGTALTYTYTCGNGTVVGPTTTSKATCSYSTGGRYTVTLKVTDGAGLSDTTSTTLRL